MDQGLIEFGGSAVIPTGDYMNAQPSFTVRADTFEEARDLWLKEMRVIHEMLGKPLEVRGESAGRPVGIEKRCWASGSIVYFDPIEHVYRDAQGNQYLGGSTFAHRFVPDFPAESIAGKMAEKSDSSADEIRAMWQLNSEASTSFGTALHAALELRQRYGKLSLQLKGDYSAATTKNPVLKPIVEAFFTPERDAEEAVAECFVADPERRHAGMLDRLVIEPDGVWIEDYKSSRDVLKAESIKIPFKGIVPNNQLGIFQLQCNFYARILTTHGVKVKGLRVHHWTGEVWDTHELEILDLDKIMTEANQ